MTHRVRSGRVLIVAIAFVLAGCSAGQVPLTAAPSSQLTAPTVPAAESPTTSPTLAAMTVGPSASTSAACMDAATLDLVQKNMGKFDKLTQAQRDSIVAALEAYDFGTDATSAKWRDDVVAAIKKGDSGHVWVGLAMSFAMGTVSLKACP